MQTGTLTSAAELIGTSQPGASSLITALEHQLGFPLFLREKKRLLPTQEARHFLPIAERLVNDMEDARKAALLISEGRYGELTIATLPGLSLNILPVAIRDFRKQSPDTRVKISTRTTEAVRRMIPNQQCDVAIVETPIDPGYGDVTLMSMDCVAILPAHHPIAGLDVVTPRDLRDEPIISLFREHPTSIQLETAFISQGCAFFPVVEARLFATCCEMVSNDGGVAVVDTASAKRYASSNIVIRPFRPTIRFEFALVLPKQPEPSRAARAFAEIFASVFHHATNSENQSR